MSIATKVMIQMAAKLGGEPWRVSVPKQVISKFIRALKLIATHLTHSFRKQFVEISRYSSIFNCSYSFWMLLMLILALINCYGLIALFSINQIITRCYD